MLSSNVVNLQQDYTIDLRNFGNFILSEDDEISNATLVEKGVQVVE